MCSYVRVVFFVLSESSLKSRFESPKFLKSWLQYTSVARAAAAKPTGHAERYMSLWFVFSCQHFIFTSSALSIRKWLRPHSGTQYAAPRAFHTSNFSRVWLKRLCCFFLSAFLKQTSSRAHVMFRTLLDPAPFSSTLSTPTSSSTLLCPSNRTNPCAFARTLVWSYG